MDRDPIADRLWEMVDSLGEREQHLPQILSDEDDEPIPEDEALAESRGILASREISSKALRVDAAAILLRLHEQGRREALRREEHEREESLRLWRARRIRELGY